MTSTDVARPPALQAAAVTLRRGEVEVLRGVDLVVRPGERWALLGPNGCGKTSLLSLLGALQHPTTGTVDVLGSRLGRVDLVRELWPRIGHVQGRHRPAGRLTAQQVVLTGLTGTNALPLRWTPSGEELDRAADGLRRLGIGDLADRPWPLLSNGEQRRTLLARALVREPDLLLLDEPAAGLDLPAREALVDALDALAARRPELASVLVSHHVEELPAGTTHAALLRAGRLTASGPVDDVLVDGALSECFGLPLRVTREGGRWSARGAGASGERPGPGQVGTFGPAPDAAAARPSTGAVAAAAPPDAGGPRVTGSAAPRLDPSTVPQHPGLPTRLLRAVGVLRPSAVDNAREALTDLHIALTDRDLLAPADGQARSGELVVLDRAECLRLLGQRSIGRFAYVARAGVPDVVPVNYALDGDDVVLRSGPGPKLQAAERGDTVAFEVDAIDELTRTGWSVVVVGQAHRVGPAEVAGEPEPWAVGPRRHLVRITPTRITGRRITG